MDYPIVAYTERDSIDPVTCEEGKLRREWALVTPGQLRQDMGITVDPRFCQPVVTIFRYIRRGKVEPWSLFDYYETEEDALRGIWDSGLIPVDPRLVAIQEQRAEDERIRKAQEDLERTRAHEREEKAREAAQVNECFRKMVEGSTEGKEIGDRWNRFTTSATDAEKAALSEDKDFMSFYTVAVKSVRVPEKRKAMRQAMERAEKALGRAV